MADSSEKGAHSAVSTDLRVLIDTLDTQAEVEQEQARQAEFANRALEAQFHLGVRSGIRRATRLLKQMADA